MDADRNRVYEPKDTLRETHTYEGKLTFNHEFTLKFPFKLRGYDNINTKAAFLDLLANILVVTYRTGTFWPGEQHIIGIPQDTAGWNKAESIIDGFVNQTGTLLENLAAGKPIADSAGIFAQQVGSMLDGVLGINIQDIVTNPKETMQSITEKLKDTNFLSGIKSSLFSIGSYFVKSGYQPPVKLLSIVTRPQIKPLAPFLLYSRFNS